MLDTRPSHESLTEVEYKAGKSQEEKECSVLPCPALGACPEECCVMGLAPLTCPCLATRPWALCSRPAVKSHPVLQGVKPEITAPGEQASERPRPAPGEGTARSQPPPLLRPEILSSLAAKHRALEGIYPSTGCAARHPLEGRITLLLNPASL